MTKSNSLHTRRIEGRRCSRFRQSCATLRRRASEKGLTRRGDGPVGQIMDRSAPTRRDQYRSCAYSHGLSSHSPPPAARPRGQAAATVESPVCEGAVRGRRTTESRGTYVVQKSENAGVWMDRCDRISPVVGQLSSRKSSKMRCPPTSTCSTALQRPRLCTPTT